MCTVILNRYIHCQDLNEFPVPWIFNGNKFLHQWRECNAVRSVCRGSIYPQSAMTVDSICQHFGVTGVRWRVHCGGLRYLLKAECLAFHCGDGEEGGYVFCLSGMNIFWWTYPRAWQQGSNQSRAVTSKGSYLCTSAKDVLCLHKQQEHTHLLLTTCVGLYGKSDRESNKWT